MITSDFSYNTDNNKCYGSVKINNVIYNYKGEGTIEKAKKAVAKLAKNLNQLTKEQQQGELITIKGFVFKPIISTNSNVFYKKLNMVKEGFFSLFNKTKSIFDTSYFSFDTPSFSKDNDFSGVGLKKINPSNPPLDGKNYFPGISPTTTETESRPTIPKFIRQKIFSYLKGKDLLALRGTSKFFNQEMGPFICDLLNSGSATLKDLGIPLNVLKEIIGENNCEKIKRLNLKEGDFFTNSDENIRNIDYLHEFPNIEHLTVVDNSINKLTVCMENLNELNFILPRLTKLELIDIKLGHLQWNRKDMLNDPRELPWNLQELALIDCKNLESMRINSLESLKKLTIIDCKHLESIDIPTGWVLKEISLQNCPNVKTLNSGKHTIALNVTTLDSGKRVVALNVQTLKSGERIIAPKVFVDGEQLDNGDQLVQWTPM